MKSQSYSVSIANWFSFQHLRLSTVQINFLCFSTVYCYWKCVQLQHSSHTMPWILQQWFGLVIHHWCMTFTKRATKLMPIISPTNQFQKTSISDFLIDWMDFMTTSILRLDHIERYIQFCLFKSHAASASNIFTSKRQHLLIFARIGFTNAYIRF